jgi:tRNA dimethylallyltransferase
VAHVPNLKELEAAHIILSKQNNLENYTVGDYEKEAIIKLEELFFK